MQKGYNLDFCCDLKYIRIENHPFPQRGWGREEKEVGRNKENAV